MHTQSFMLACLLSSQLTAYMAKRMLKPQVRTSTCKGAPHQGLGIESGSTSSKRMFLDFMIPGIQAR